MIFRIANGGAKRGCLQNARKMSLFLLFAQAHVCAGQMLVVKYSTLQKEQGFLKRPIYDGESELSIIVKAVRFARVSYQKLYHQRYNVVTIIWTLTFTLFVLRIVHEYIQRGIAGDPLR